MYTIGSSIITMDHLNFRRDILFAEELGIDYLHVDVMDSNLVPRFGIYPEIVAEIAKVSTLKMDVHLMIDKVEWYVDSYIDIPNIEYVSFHADENRPNLFRIADKIRAHGKKPIITFNLSTPIDGFIDAINDETFSGVMLMGIHPGVLVQKARPELVERKLKQISKNLNSKSSEQFIQIDGAVTFDRLKTYKSLGANNFICGSSTLYKGIDYRTSTDDAVLTRAKENMKVIQKELMDD